ncbi:MAG: DUF3179 domain-containing protein [Mariprofundaceae bacterium]|nr:DUF3179 domain-containing protein [Mariprofundaceae bacterium]
MFHHYWLKIPFIHGKYSRFIIYPLFALLLFPFLKSAAYELGGVNGFRIDAPLVSKNEIYQGGPARDGIPALDNPVFLAADDDNFLEPDDRVLGLSLNGVTRAYPIKILNHHELVNDMFNGKPVLISFCPLCGTGVAFDTMVRGQRLMFAVSGLLYNNDVLMYDRKTDSLWSQIQNRAVTGSFKGELLITIPLEHTRWVDWKQQHPKTQVLSSKTGYVRNYDASPYAGYDTHDTLYFPISVSDSRYRAKDRVIGISVKGHTKAYPFVELAKMTMPVHDHFAGLDLIIKYNDDAKSATISDSNGKTIHTLTAFWFAWFAFHPNTEVLTAK